MAKALVNIFDPIRYSAGLKTNKGRKIVLACLDHCIHLTKGATTGISLEGG